MCGRHWKGKEYERKEKSPLANQRIVNLGHGVVGRRVILCAMGGEVNLTEPPESLLANRVWKLRRREALAINQSHITIVTKAIAPVSFVDGKAVAYLMLELHFLQDPSKGHGLLRVAGADKRLLVDLLKLLRYVSVCGEYSFVLCGSFSRLW